jgi:hypothetical protein
MMMIYIIDNQGQLTMSGADFFGWARLGKSWRLVATGASAAEAHRALLDWIKAQGRAPLASAVLPAGVHPASQDGPSASNVR